MRTSLVLAIAILFTGGVALAAEPTMCTMQYDPVCAVKDGERRTYGNSCTAGADGATVLYRGECRTQGYVPPENCTAWFDGCNSCSRSENGEAMCTLMACEGAQREGYCTEYEKGTAPEIVPAPEKPTPTVEEALAATGTSAAEVSLQSFFTRLWTYLVARISGIF